MPDRESYIPGVPCWTDTTQPDTAKAAEFYRDLFGWGFDENESAHFDYRLATIRGRQVAGISAIAEGAPQDMMWNTYVAVDSADDATARARDAGAQVILEPFDVMDAGRMAVIADPEGAVFCVWEAKKNPGSQVVNEHGSVNFNNLNTRDPKKAEAFYGAVFGWKVISIESGLAWALPGYGDHLEELTPGLHEQMEQMGAPEGFIDVVASVHPIADDDTTTQAHWSVTFAVDDVDAVAAKAKELGAEVLSGPVDAPWSRTVEIRDPQGVGFIASQFVPENRDVEG